MDELRFYIFLTVFQSYKDDGKVIIKKGCVQWKPVHGMEDFRLKQVSNPGSLDH